MEEMRAYEKRSGNGYVVPLLFDVLIRRVPKLQTRQPDALYVTKERLEQGGGIPEKGFLTIAPEIVVEIISDSERQREIEARIKDYIEIGVQECWIVRPGRARAKSCN